MKQQLRDPHFIKAIGVKLRRVRQIKGLTLEAVYEETKIHVARIEQGNLNITISTLSFLLNYYNITPMEFFAEGFENNNSSFNNTESEEQ